MLFTLVKQGSCSVFLEIIAPPNLYKGVGFCGLGSGRTLFLGALRGTTKFQRS